MKTLFIAAVVAYQINALAISFDVGPVHVNTDSGPAISVPQQQNWSVPGVTTPAKIPGITEGGPVIPDGVARNIEVPFELIGGAIRETVLAVAQIPLETVRQVGIVYDHNVKDIAGGLRVVALIGTCGLSEVYYKQQMDKAKKEAGDELDLARADNARARTEAATGLYDALRSERHHLAQFVLENDHATDFGRRSFSISQIISAAIDAELKLRVDMAKLVVIIEPLTSNAVIDTESFSKKMTAAGSDHVAIEQALTTLDLEILEKTKGDLDAIGALMAQSFRNMDTETLRKVGATIKRQVHFISQTDVALDQTKVTAKLRIHAIEVQLSQAGQPL